MSLFAFTNAISSSASTTIARPRSPVTVPLINGRNNHVPHNAMPALSMPKISDVRTRPSFGTNKIGNRIDASSAPM